ncbi:tRNA (N6-isopentenyl adenosine(37)-C2)-methylthiotransferase MiaB [bacterium]|nr:tRNA (N6-isopentenyl adenosine(37)-C2)-methylthiotransferase MiaB [bacterium]
MTEPAKGLFIRTHGCQMNVYDSERMTDILRPLGYRAVDTPEAADLVILNTCHIREKATEKVFSELGVLKRLKDEAGGKMRIAVAGCVAQAEGEEIMRRQPAVDIVVGPQSYHRLPELIAQVSRQTGDRLATDFDVVDKFDALAIDREVDGPSAFLSIQEGCDKFCTFCVVPYTRGPEYARSAVEIIDEAKALVDRGVREIVLLGQNVNAWRGAAPDGGGEWELGALIARLSQLGGLERIRYTTSHPRDMTDDLIFAHRDVAKLAPYLHLPVQSGSDRILKAMNRGHDAKRYLTIIETARKHRPDLAVASDFIVGFPGETEADFEATLALVREVRFASAFAFKYSPRPGTPAASLPGAVPDAEKDERLQRLQAEIGRGQQAFNSATVGRVLRVIFGRPGRRPGQALGYSPYLQPVHVDDAASWIGRSADVEIRSATQSSLSGEIRAHAELRT